MGAILLALTLTAAATPIVGTYRCTGDTAHGSRYTIQLDVRAFQDGYLLQWSNQGKPTNAGLGFRDGDVLVVAFTDGRGLGVARYQIGEGLLDGKWWVGESLRIERCEQGETKEAE